jgi:hypothetical protein
MIEKLVPLQMCDRVRGFWFGYSFRSGSWADLRNPQFCTGWNEGLSLLLDERRAAAEAQARKEKQQ